MTAQTHSHPQTDQLKDYFCPFCKTKLFRGKVEEFRMVCQECNRLIDSKKLADTMEDKKDSDHQE